MRILITGASGYLGTALVNALCHNPKDSIFAIYHTTPPTIEHANVIWQRCNLNSQEEINKLPACDTIIHCAQAKNYRDPDSAPSVFALNTQSAFFLLEWSVKNSVKKFLYTSTGSIYGTLSPDPCNESQLPQPDTFYSASKMAAETIMHAFSSHFGCHILRIFTLYGPGQTDRLIPSLIARIKKGDAITVVNDRGLLITPVFIDDVIGAIRNVILTPTKNSIDILNVAGSEHFSIKQLSLAIGEALGLAVKFDITSGLNHSLTADRSLFSQRYPEFISTSFSKGLDNTLAVTDSCTEN